MKKFILQFYFIFQIVVFMLLSLFNLVLTIFIILFVLDLSESIADLISHMQGIVVILLINALFFYIFYQTLLATYKIIKNNSITKLNKFFMYCNIPLIILLYYCLKLL